MTDLPKRRHAALRFIDLPFGMSTDPLGRMHLYCDRPRCPWIKEVPQHSSLIYIERVASGHRCKQK